MLLRLAPALFVLLWSTGFIGMKLGAASAEPFTFLSLRFIAAILILLPISLLRGALKAGWRQRSHAALVGSLMHGGYLGGVLWAIRHGMPAGVIALIVGLQPILASMLASPLLGEQLTSRHWVGLTLGFLGVLLTVGPRFWGAEAGLGAGVDAATVSSGLIALLSLTIGTLYQKHFASGSDLVGGALWQYVGGLGIVGAAALLFETRDVIWSPQFIFALAWLVLALSIGAILLLLLLIRQHAVSGVSGLFYLVPACTGIMAYIMFDERLAALQIVGMALAIAGVFLIARGQRASARPEVNAVATD
jgi:drug/metabolite transporter (DMT)-like permease